MLTRGAGLATSKLSSYVKTSYVQSSHSYPHQYHTSSSNYNAFTYLEKYKNEINPNRTTYIYKHKDFSVKYNDLTDVVYSEAKSPTEIRVIYDPKSAESPVIKKDIPESRLKYLVDLGNDYAVIKDQLIEEELGKAIILNPNLGPQELEDQKKEYLIAGRSICKASARDYHEKLEGGKEWIKVIHESETIDKGDPMGHSHETLSKKLNVEGSSRKRRRVEDVAKLRELDLGSESKHTDNKS